MPLSRPRVRGKFLSVDDEKFYVRGVTYGTFRPDADGNECSGEVVGCDFAQMAASGIALVALFAGLAGWALGDGAWVVALSLGGASLVLAIRAGVEAASARAVARSALRGAGGEKA